MNYLLFISKKSGFGFCLPLCLRVSVVLNLGFNFFTKEPKVVIPAKAGIQSFQYILDPPVKPEDDNDKLIMTYVAVYRL